jgi:type IV secretion system protein VirB10
MTVETAAPPVSETPATPGKVDPETLALRAQPTRAIRFKRGAVVAITALGSVSLIATAWVALRPSALHLAGQADDQTVMAKAPTDTLSRLPGSYGDVPKLGPPLPGDLGRPILNHQREMGIESASGEAGRADQAAASERDRRATELRAARESGLLVQSGNRTDPTRGTEATPFSPSAATAQETRLAIDPDRDPNAQQRKADFVAARDNDGDVSEHRMSPPASPYMLSAGTVIAASLITGLRSDIPGLVTAQVTEPVFDTVTGRTMLIPQGSRLIGSYDSVVAFGQSRALLVWQRIILPDGSSIQIDNLPATDAAGYAGLSDKVDFHSWQLLKGVALSTLLGVGTQLSIGGDSDLVRAIRESTQQSASQAGQQIVAKQLNVQPTIQVRPGWPLRVIVHKDLVMRAWAGQ